MSSALDHLLRDASETLGCATVAIRCDCENLETVYAEREGDLLMITDRGETYAYLSGDQDDTTYDIDLLTEDEARAICQRHGVDLHVDDEAELFPRIRREVTAADDVPAVVAAVAAAIDEVFAAVMRPDLRRP
jgi:hypothetical protein